MNQLYYFAALRYYVLFIFGYFQKSPKKEHRGFKDILDLRDIIHFSDLPQNVLKIDRPTILFRTFNIYITHYNYLWCSCVHSAVKLLNECDMKCTIINHFSQICTTALSDTKWTSVLYLIFFFQSLYIMSLVKKKTTSPFESFLLYIE